MVSQQHVQFFHFSLTQINFYRIKMGLSETLSHNTLQISLAMPTPSKATPFCLTVILVKYFHNDFYVTPTSGYSVTQTALQ